VLFRSGNEPGAALGERQHLMSFPDG